MFALESVDSLTRLADRIATLADRALEPNPFLLPEFLEPAIQGLAARRVQLLVYSEHSHLRFFAPVVSNRGVGVFAGRLTLWAHDYAPLGTPLIDREFAPQVADSLMDFLSQCGRKLLSFPHLPLAGQVAGVLRQAAERTGFATEAERQLRPILSPNPADRASSFDQIVSAKRRRDLDRLLRRLSEQGSVHLSLARSASEVDQALGTFAELEGRGWKGRRGTALSCVPHVYKFARTAIVGLSGRGLAGIDILRVGERPIAALIRINHARLPSRGK